MNLKHMTKPSLFFIGFTAVYTIVVLANLGEENGALRWIFLAAVASIAIALQVRSAVVYFELATFFKFVHFALAILYLWAVLFGKWAKRGDPDEGALSADGGTGFGIIAIVLGFAFLILAIMRIMGRSKVLPGLGVEQLTVILGVAAWMNILAFVVGWLATFEAGTGWGPVVAYFPSSLIPQLGAITLAATEPGQGIRDLEAGKRRALSVVALVCGVGVALFPFLTYVTAGSISLSALDGKIDGNASGPRLGYILLIFGTVAAVGSLMRLRPAGLAEPGPNALVGHALLAVGLVAFLIPLATLISIVRHSADIGAGIGVWLGLLAGLALVVLALLENRNRGAVAA